MFPRVDRELHGDFTVSVEGIMTNEQIVIRIKAGIDRSGNMQKLWEQNRALIRDMAKRYKGYADMEDLEQEGYIALYDAVEGYDPEKGYKFMTYARHWIRQGMKRYIDNCCSTIRIPVHEKEKLQEYRKLVNAFQMYRNRKPTAEETAYNMHLDMEQVHELEAALKLEQIGSLDAYLSEDDENSKTAGDMIPSDMDVESLVLDSLEACMVNDTVWEVVGSLPDNLAGIIKDRYREGKTLKEIGQSAGIPLKEIYSMEAAAMRGLRRPERRNRLAMLLPELVEARAYRHIGVAGFNRTWTSSTEKAALMDFKIK